MLSLYIIRHGQTVWNREHRVQGSLDSPLTWGGCQQARRLGERLAMDLHERGVDRQSLQLRVSPLARTLQTAAIIGDRLEVDFQRWGSDAALRELAWGDWEGLRFADIEARFPGAMSERERDRWHHRPPGGENCQEGHQRAREWLAGLPEHGTLVAVSHGGIGRLLRGCYLAMAPAAILPMDAPQDALFRLEGGNMQRLEVADLANI